MTSRPCDDWAERLVDYADGELPPDESAMVSEHVASCAGCHETLVALRQSLRLAEIVWQDAEAELADVEAVWHRRVNSKETSGGLDPAMPARQQRTGVRRFLIARPVLAAASILLVVLAGSAVWHFVLRAGRRAAPDETTPIIVRSEDQEQRHGATRPATDGHAPTTTELEAAITRVGAAAELLAAADFLAEYPEGRDIAKERYRYIAATYPETDAAVEARSRLGS